MTPWISLAAAVVVFLFLITRRVGVRMEGSKEGFTVSASFSRLRFTVHPRHAENKREKGNQMKKNVKLEEDKEEERKPERKRQQDRIKNALEWLRLLGNFSDVVNSGLGYLRRHGRIGKLNLKGKLGTGDPCLTGTFYGLLEGLKGILSQAVPSSKIEISPEFGEEILGLSGAFEVEIRLIYLFFLIIFLLWSLPKRKIWRLARSS